MGQGLVMKMLKMMKGMDKISKVTNPYQILQHAYTHAWDGHCYAGMDFLRKWSVFLIQV